MKRSIAILAGVVAVLLAFAGALPARALSFDGPVLVQGFDDTTYDMFEPTQAGDFVYFTRVLDMVVPGERDVELWYTDGVTAHLIDTFNKARGLIEYQGTLYFSASRGEEGVNLERGLWSATPSGATLVASHPGYETDSGVGALQSFDGLLYFDSYNYGAQTQQLWSWDGDSETAVGSGWGQISTFKADGELFATSGAGYLHEGSLLRVVPGGGLENLGMFLGNMRYVAQLNGTWVVLGTHGDVFGLWESHGTDDPTLLLAVSSYDSYWAAASGDRVIVFGTVSGQAGFWAWDGSTVSELSGSVSLQQSLLIVNSPLLFYGDDGTHQGYWTITGDEPVFLTAASYSWLWPVGDGYVGRSDGLQAGESLPERAFFWNGTSDAIVPLGPTGPGEWSTVEESGVGDGFVALITLNDADEFELWSIPVSAVQSIEMVPATSVVTAGQSVEFTVTGYDIDGLSVGDVTTQTTLSAPGAAIAGDSVTFTTAGEYTVTATHGSSKTTSTVTVNPAPLDSIEISPSSPAIAVGGTQAFTVEGFDVYGNSLGDYTDAAALTTTVPGAVATGNTIAFWQTGSGEVMAQVGAISAHVPVTVEEGTLTSIELGLSATTVPVGGKVTVTVTGLNENGFAIQDLTGEAVIKSDHASDVISGNTVRFPSASPHTITATVREVFSDAVTVQVQPAALAYTGYLAGSIVPFALLLLLVGIATIVTVRLRDQKLRDQR